VQRSRMVPMLAVLATYAAACGPMTEVSAPGVEVRDNFFSPTLFVAANGEEITWTWRGTQEHSVTFEDNIGSTPLPKATGTIVRTFTTNGNHRYRCTNHSMNFTAGMVGTIIVP